MAKLTTMLRRLSVTTNLVCYLFIILWLKETKTHSYFLYIFLDLNMPVYLIKFVLGLFQQMALGCGLLTEIFEAVDQ